MDARALQIAESETRVFTFMTDVMSKCKAYVGNTCFSSSICTIPNDMFIV